MTTDLGVERHIAKVFDVVPEFLQYIAARHGQGLPRILSLFPCALQTPVRKHIMDGLLQCGLCSTTWFPQWVVVLKQCVHFLRVHQESFCA